MAEDIWERLESEIRKGLGWTKTIKDTLAELKVSFDESIADCHHSLELVAKKLGDYREKAEKWNELCEGLEYGGNTPVSDILQEINLIDRDNELRKTKLEAVKAWLIDAKLKGRISMNAGFSLGLVLGVEE